jgi:cytochrome c-type biogenesis protein CcmH
MNLKRLITIFFLFFVSVEANENNNNLTEIYKNLRCLVCQGQSVADSNSDFASTLKLVVQDQVKEGKSADEIYEFLISKYGEWIVYNPPFNKKNFFLWVLPYLFLILGGLFLSVLIRKNRHNKAN